MSSCIEIMWYERNLGLHTLIASMHCYRQLHFYLRSQLEDFKWDLPA